MRIIAFSQYYPPEIAAAGIRLHGLLRGLVDHGHSVTVITAIPNYPQRKVYPGYRGKDRREEILEGVRVLHVPFFLPRSSSLVQRFWSYFSFMVSLFIAGLRQHRPELVIATSPPLFTAVAAWIWAKLWRRSLLFDVQDLWPESIESLGVAAPGSLIRLAYSLSSAIYRRSARISTVAEGLRRVLIERKGVPAEHVAVVFNCLDLHTQAPASEEEVTRLRNELGVSGKTVALYAGNLGVAQHPLTLVEAASKLADLPHLLLLVVGDGVERKSVESEALLRGLGNIRFMGPVPRSELRSFYGLASMGIVLLRDLALFDAALPTKIFEYWSFGLPILGGVRGEAASLIQEVAGGLVFPPENGEALASGIRQLCSATDQGKAMGLAGRKAVLERFNGKIQAEVFSRLAGEAESSGKRSRRP